MNQEDIAVLTNARGDWVTITRPGIFFLLFCGTTIHQKKKKKKTHLLFIEIFTSYRRWFEYLNPAWKNLKTTKKLISVHVRQLAVRKQRDFVNKKKRSHEDSIIPLVAKMKPYMTQVFVVRPINSQNHNNSNRRSKFIFIKFVCRKNKTKKIKSISWGLIDSRSRPTSRGIQYENYEKKRNRWQISGDDDETKQNFFY